MSVPELVDDRDLQLRDIPTASASLQKMIDFAHTIDGYKAAGSFERAVAIGEAPDPNSLTEQRIALFIFHRSLRTDIGGPSQQDVAKSRQLIRRIRELVQAR